MSEFGAARDQGSKVVAEAEAKAAAVRQAVEGLTEKAERDAAATRAEAESAALALRQQADKALVDAKADAERMLADARDDAARPGSVRDRPARGSEPLGKRLHG